MVKSTVENLQITGQGKKEDSGISIEILSSLQVRDRTLKDVRNKWHLFIWSQKKSLSFPKHAYKHASLEKPAGFP